MTNSRDYFGRVAEQWDEIRQGYFSDRVREVAIARANLTPDMVVADVGSGTGFMAAGLAPRVKQVICLDNSPEMLAVAGRNLAQNGNVQLRLAEGERLTLADSSVHAVFANMYLHHMPDPLVAIREMVRILKPGGILVITDMDRHDNEWQRVEMADLWLGFERDQVRAWYEEAGLTEVEIGDTGET